MHVYIFLLYDIASNSCFAQNLILDQLTLVIHVIIILITNSKIGTKVYSLLFRIAIRFFYENIIMYFMDKVQVLSYILGILKKGNHMLLPKKYLL